MYASKISNANHMSPRKVEMLESLVYLIACEHNASTRDLSGMIADEIQTLSPRDNPLFLVAYSAKCITVRTAGGATALEVFAVTTDVSVIFAT